MGRREIGKKGKKKVTPKPGCKKKIYDQRKKEKGVRKERERGDDLEKRKHFFSN